MLRGKQHVPLDLHRLDLLEQQFQPIELTANLRLQVIRQQATIAELKRNQPLPPVTAQRLVARYPLSEQQPLHAIDVPDPFRD